MMQVSLIAYAVGGAFLSLAYFDLPYNIMAIVVVTRVWVQRQAWLHEPGSVSNWLVSLGISSTQFPVKSAAS